MKTFIFLIAAGLSTLLSASEGLSKNVPLDQAFYRYSYYDYAFYKCDREVNRMIVSFEIDIDKTLSIFAGDAYDQLSLISPKHKIREIYTKSRPPILAYFKAQVDFLFDTKTLTVLKGRYQGKYKCKLAAERK